MLCCRAVVGFKFFQTRNRGWWSFFPPVWVSVLVIVTSLQAVTSFIDTRAHTLRGICAFKKARTKNQQCLVIDFWMSILNELILTRQNYHRHLYIFSFDRSDRFNMTGIYQFIKHIANENIGRIRSFFQTNKFCL